MSWLRQIKSKFIAHLKQPQLTKELYKLYIYEYNIYVLYMNKTVSINMNWNEQ